MPPAAAVKTLASSFEGLSGATALSVIAFGVVFLVLILLTFVIFAMRFVTKFAGSEKAAPAPAAKPAASAVASASVASADDDELVAVIAAAIAAQTGTSMRIRSIVPAGTHLIGVDNTSWIACGRLEGLQGALSDRWN